MCQILITWPCLGSLGLFPLAPGQTSNIIQYTKQRWLWLSLGHLSRIKVWAPQTVFKITAFFIHAFSLPPWRCAHCYRRKPGRSIGDAACPALGRNFPSTWSLQGSHFLTHPPPLFGLLLIMVPKYFSAGTKLAGEILVKSSMINSGFLPSVLH